MVAPMGFFFDSPDKHDLSTYSYARLEPLGSALSADDNYCLGTLEEKENEH